MGLLRPKNVPKRTSEQLLCNFQKVKRTDFIALKMVKIGQNDDVTEVKILPKNLVFGGHQNFLVPILHESMGLLSIKIMPQHF